MKTSLVSAALVAVLLGGVSLATYAFGQAGAPVSANGQNLAVIDVGLVFEKHVRFKQQMDALKVDIEQADKGFKAQADDMNRGIEQLKTLKPDDPDYRRRETELAKQRVDFESAKQAKNKEIMDRQSKIYLRTYQEVEDAVKQISVRYNIALVIRFNSKPIDSNDPQEILRGIQRPLVYVDTRYDMTGAVTDSLNRSAPTGPLGNTTGPIGVSPPR